MRNGEGFQPGRGGRRRLRSVLAARFTLRYHLCFPDLLGLNSHISRSYGSTHPSSSNQQSKIESQHGIWLDFKSGAELQRALGMSPSRADNTVVTTTRGGCMDLEIKS